MPSLLLLSLLAAQPWLDAASLRALGLNPTHIAPEQLAGTWVREDAPTESVEVLAGPTPPDELQGWPGLDHGGGQRALRRAHLHPDEQGLSVDLLHLDCGMNHFDPPVRVTWLAISPDALVRVLLVGGWSPELQVARFRRARPGEPFDPGRPPHADPAPAEHAERRDRW